MDILFLTGSHPRHQYVARKLDSLGHLAGMVVQDRGGHIPEPPEDLTDEQLRELYTHHFERRHAAEQEFFSHDERPDVPQIEVPIGELNTPTMRSFVDTIDHDLAISYGTKILSDESLDTLADEAWNIHAGLSPQYKGGITHYWPSYMLEPQMTGITLHQLTMNVDGGPIVHHSTGSLVRGDGIHELACRTVKEFVDDHLPTVIELFEQDELGEPVPQTRHGKLWYGADWRPEHLRLVYETFDNEIVDRYLDGEFEQSEPDLVEQF